MKLLGDRTISIMWHVLLRAVFLFHSIESDGGEMCLAK